MSGAPSKTVFVEGYFSTGWSPYAALPDLATEEWYRLDDLCPQWPESIFE